MSTLAHLKAQGYKIGVASNSVRQTVGVMMGRANLMPYLDVVLSNEDVQAAKPDPEIYQLVIAELELEPDQVLVVEDNAHGIESAQAAGARVMVVDDPTAVTLDAIERAITNSETTA